MKYIWDSEDWKWVPASEYKSTNPKRTLYFSVYKSGFNPGLGCYVGSRDDRRAALDRIEQNTGSRPIEIGNERVSPRPQVSNYEFPRGGLEAIKNG